MRFFYWQVVAGRKLAKEAVNQRIKVELVTSSRGKIFARDGYPLVLNRKLYSLFLWRPEIKVSWESLIDRLAAILGGEEKEEKREVLKERIEKGSNWICLEKRVTEEEKKKIEELGLTGLSFEEEEVRFYPEGSSAAHLLGFLGQDETGRTKGFFGLEGFYDRQLRGVWEVRVKEKGVFSWLDFLGRNEDEEKKGRDLYLYLDRTIQFLALEELKKGIKKYGAQSGWVVVLSPEGEVLAMAAWPNYDPARYFEFKPEFYPNPVIATTFEPGSIFKPLVVAAALEEGVVKPEDRCEICDGPVRIGEYQIETWNNQYYPQSTIGEIIKHSDNVGMVWVSGRLGKEKLIFWLKRLGFDRKTGIDLEEESYHPLRPENEWYPIDLATVAFGQGIAVTPIQMIRAFTALANGGRLVSPRVVAKIEGEKEKWWERKREEEKIFSSETIKQLEEILVTAVEEGEAKWTKLKGYRVAGKTGTAQIPLSGHYDEEKTIASFIGFVPAEKPRFVMLVSLREPTASPWGAETAAPLWFSLAKKILYYLGVPPSRGD